MTTPSITDTRMEAIRKLRTHDHAILTTEAAQELAAPFDVEPRVATFQDSRSDFKGITLYGDDMIPNVSRDRGVDAHGLAETIADSLGLEYPQCMGVGSRLRVACDAVIAHLEGR